MLPTVQERAGAAGGIKSQPAAWIVIGISVPTASAYDTALFQRNAAPAAMTFWS
jgi:hypothetical protein